MAGIWAFIIPVLVQLIVTFLTQLLQGLNPLPSGMMGSAALPDLVAAKADFLAKLKWRFWLGPKRYQYASALYDRMHARFSVNLSSSGVLDVPLTVNNCTVGLEKLLPADLGDGLRMFAVDGALNYTILENGLVRGGSASYVLNSLTGVIAYRASIRVGKWLFTKTYESSGQYQVDPTLLNPTNLSVGKVITLGSVQLKVVSIDQATALVFLSSLQDSTGNAILSTNLPVVTLVSIDATVHVMGLDLLINVRQA